MVSKMAISFETKIDKRVDVEGHPLQVMCTAKGLAGEYSELSIAAPIDTDAYGRPDFSQLASVFNEIMQAAFRLAAKQAG